MSAPFFAQLEARSRTSLLCVGLDPRADDAGAALDRCRAIVAATAPVAAAFKPNIAFFEALGPPGLEALAELIASIPDEIPVLVDAKRGDIASTSSAYATALFDRLGAGAVTVSPYLGLEALQPFMDRGGVFILCRTSNPGAAELQEMAAGGGPVYLSVARMVGELPTDRAGLVVGATDPEALAAVRQEVPDHWILAPGLGAQGASLTEAMAAGIRADGSGLLLPVARFLAEASDPGAAARELSEAIAEGRRTPAPRPADDRLALDLFDTGCVRFGDFELKSGVASPVYLDLRALVGHPAVLQRVARLVGHVVGERSDLIAGVPLAGIPLATAVSLETGLPMIYPRPRAKDHGTRSLVEGPYDPGRQVVLVDDVATSGASILEAATVLRDVGLVVAHAVAVVDREAGATDALAAEGIELHRVTRLESVVDSLVRAGRISGSEAERVRSFVRA